MHARTRKCQSNPINNNCIKWHEPNISSNPTYYIGKNFLRRWWFGATHTHTRSLARFNRNSVGDKKPWNRSNILFRSFCLEKFKSKIAFILLCWGVSLCLLLSFLDGFGFFPLEIRTSVCCCCCCFPPSTKSINHFLHRMRFAVVLTEFQFKEIFRCHIFLFLSLEFGWPWCKVERNN